MYLNERSPKTLDELVTWAEQYLRLIKKSFLVGNQDEKMRRMEAEGETRKDPAARYSVSDVVAKDIVPQNAFPGCQMGIAERKGDTKGDFRARSVAVMGMKPENVVLHHGITMHSVPDQMDPNLHHRCIVRDVRLRFESCLE